jgi:hypothetical protein
VPSIEAQDAWLQQTGREAWSAELALIVAEHHRLSDTARQAGRAAGEQFAGPTSST